MEHLYVGILMVLNLRYKNSNNSYSKKTSLLSANSIGNYGDVRLVYDAVSVISTSHLLNTICAFSTLNHFISKRVVI